jgi:hypothetical protein
MRGAWEIVAVRINVEGRNAERAFSELSAEELRVVRP